MQRAQRKIKKNFLSGKQLQTSIIQGLMITAGCLGLGYYFMQHDADAATVRTIIFITLLFSNIFLTLVNRSFKYSIFKTLRYKNSMISFIIILAFAFIFLAVYVAPVRNLFLLQQLKFSDLAACFVVAIAGTLWIELFKLAKSKFIKF
jgi:Ca2+-transporting ATPase